MQESVFGELLDLGAEDDRLGKPGLLGDVIRPCHTFYRIRDPSEIFPDEVHILGFSLGRSQIEGRFGDLLDDLKQGGSLLRSFLEFIRERGFCPVVRIHTIGGSRALGEMPSA